MDPNHPKVAELKALFQSVDTDNTGFISKEQFIAQINQDKKIPIYRVNLAFQNQPNSNKISEQNFILFLLGNQLGMDDFAIFKFSMQKNLAKYQSASPPNVSSNGESVKTSTANIKINKESAHEPDMNSHSLGLALGISKHDQTEKAAKLSQILGRKVSDIYVLLKFRVKQNGQEIANQIDQALSMLLEMANEMGEDPKIGALLESVELSCRYSDGEIYIVLEINNTFFSILSQYFNEALYTVSPKPHVMFELEGKSNFSQLIQESFNLFKHSAELNAKFEIDNIVLSKIKQMMVESPNFQVQSNAPITFLLEQVRFSTSFSNIGDCLESAGLSHDMVPQPSSFAEMIQSASVKQMLSQFIPEADQLVDMIGQSGEPIGEVSLNMGHLIAKLFFNVNVNGAFSLL